MRCIYSTIRLALVSGRVTVSEIATIVNEDIGVVEEKLSGLSEFDINEAMTINNELFPGMPFEKLFKVDDT